VGCSAATSRPLSQLGRHYGNLNRENCGRGIREATSKVRTIKDSDLVILDEVAFLPISKQEANKLYEFVNALYLKTSIILTSNKGFDEWSEFLGDSIITAAILDRLAHQCEIFSLEYKL